MADDMDPWVNSQYTPFRDVPPGVERQQVGISFKDKLLLVRWLQLRYSVSHDQAMRDADNLEKYMERNR